MGRSVETSQRLIIVRINPFQIEPFHELPDLGVRLSELGEKLAHAKIRRPRASWSEPTSGPTTTSARSTASETTDA